MARGGYRKPNNPAPVSGPGALARRTDGGVGSKQAQQEIRTGKYGESKKIAEQQAAAPMAGNPIPTPKMPAQAVRRATPQPTPLFAPTERPGEPVTDGMPFGPGGATPPQIPSLNTTQPTAFELTNALAPLLEFDRSGKIRLLYEMAVKRGW